MAEIPVLKIGDCLLVSIQVDMHDRLAMELQDDLTNRIVAERARGVMIDISALEIVDSFIGRMLNNIAAMSRVLDAVTVVVGMRPAGRAWSSRRMKLSQYAAQTMSCGCGRRFGRERSRPALGLSTKPSSLPRRARSL